MKQDRLQEVEAEWVTYERQFVDPPDTTTKLSTQPAPRIGVWTARPATDAEIAEEVAKRLERNCEATKRAEFESRQDYKDAKAIVSTIEWMTPDNHPLDRLTPKEWAELRRRLEGKFFDDWSWQCNQCGSDEFSSAVSEDDLADDKMSCTGCGGTEFHKVPKAVQA